MAIDVVTLKLAQKYCDEHGSFVAIYGTTTVSEISAAVTAGKAIFCKYTDSSNTVHQLSLADDTNGKYGFVEASVATSDGSTSVAGITVSLSKSTGTWEVWTGSGTIPSTAEQITYDSTAASHTTGSAAAAIAQQSSQIDDIEEKTATFYRDSQGYLCEY